MSNKNEELVNIEKIKAILRVKYPWFEREIANLTFESNDSIKTAATDGKIVYYNPSFISSLSLYEKVFVFAHEVCHVALNHIFKSKGKVIKLWNIATDAVTNAHLKNDGLELIEGCIDMPDAINYSAETIYQRLLEEQNRGEQEEDNGETDVGHDSHSMWEDAIKEREEQEQENGEKEEIDETKIFKDNEDEKKERLKKLRESLAKKSLSKSSQTSSRDLQVGNIGSSSDLIDWRKLLAEATRLDVDWTYRRAIIRNGIISPRLEAQPQPEAEILLDTSGSIDTDLLKIFLRECKSVLTTSKIKVGCFDTKFYGYQTINSPKDIEKLKFQGGGGTDFDVAVNSFSYNASNRIIFTDGLASMPKKRVSAIWVVFGGRQINPPGGKVIQITNAQLRKLHELNAKNEDKDIFR